MKAFNLLALALCLSINLCAQNASQLYQKVQQAKSTLSQDSKLIDNVLTPNDAVSVNSDQFADSKSLKYFDYNKNIYNQFRDNQDGIIALQIPHESELGSHLVLDLIEVSESFYDFSVTTSSGIKFSGRDVGGVHYRGIVRGKELNSLVALSIFENEISGIVSITGQGTINIGKLGNQEQHIIYNDANLNSSDDIDDTCYTSDDGAQNPILDDLYTNVLDGSAGDLLSNCLDMYFEIDHDIYNFLGSSTTNTSNFVAGIFNEVSTLFLNESITMEISEIFIWDTPDSYSSSSSTGLDQFVAARPTFNGDLAHLLSYLSGNSNPNNTGNAGGIANWFGGVCVVGNEDLSPHSHTRLFPDFETFPVFSRQVKVITHEIGHNLGSRHTHACVWNENDTAIDGCAGRTEGTCPVPSSIPANTGTIMSYCDRNAGIDFTLGFGDQPGNIIRGFVASLTCVESCNPGGTCNLSTNTSVLNLNENANNSSFSITSDNDWTVSDNASWLSLSTISGSGNGTVNFSVSANPTTSQRSAIITIVCNGVVANVNVNQSGAPSVCRGLDSLALVSLFNATGGPNWTIPWNLNLPLDTWQGVKVNTQGCVYELNVAYNNLGGNIPSALWNLTSLTRLNLSNNQLTGNLSSQIASLSELEWLQLNNNQLSGSIPAQVGNLSDVTLFWLHGNQFSGTIPSALGNLNKVQQFLLNDNLLVGTIPAELGNLNNVTDLRLGTNQLTGSIPTTFANLINLRGLTLSTNQLSGTIPAELSTLPLLRSMFLHENQFMGGIPPEFANSTALRTLWLYTNQMSGCYDESLSSLCTQLTSVKINNGNNFNATWTDFCNSGAGQCGTGSGCRFMDSLSLVTLYNSTSGPNWNTSWNLNLPIDNWQGVKINNEGCVDELNLSYNNLSGNIPSDLWNLISLTRLNLSGNQLTGNLSSQIGNLSEMEWLQLNNNQLTGSIPAQLGNLSNMTLFWLHGNQFSGTIPSALGNLSNAQQFLLNSNQLVGTIPSALGNLTNVTDLRLGSNQLTGSIPTSFGNLNNLRGLTLSSNQLSGPIPSELGALPQLRSVFLNENLLTGSIPPEFANSSSLRTLWLYTNQMSGCYDQSLSGLCSQITSININAGNNFDASWADFCNSGAGSCTALTIITDFPYTQGFEDGIGFWIQDSVDDFDWTRRSGSTPTSGTGPSNAATGSFYMYTEATNNNNKEAILLSPNFDLSRVTNPVLSLKLHVFGSDLGSLLIEASTDNGGSWNSIININLFGWGGINNWLTLALQNALSGYSSDIVQLRVTGTTGNGPSCDMAIDDITISSNINGDLEDCPETLSIDEPILVHSHFNAENHTSASSFILTGKYVTMTAGTDIELVSGFEVESGAVFNAFIGACQ